MHSAFRSLRFSVSKTVRCALCVYVCGVAQGARGHFSLVWGGAGGGRAAPSGLKGNFGWASGRPRRAVVQGGEGWHRRRPWGLVLGQGGLGASSRRRRVNTSIFLSHSLPLFSGMAAPPAQGRVFQYKLVLLGDSAVGKSSLVLRFVRGQFFEYQESTIGAAFLTQTVALNETTVKFEIWDTAGQERYHSLAPMYYRGAAAAIVVYDITNRVSITLAPRRAAQWRLQLLRVSSGERRLTQPWCLHLRRTRSSAPSSG